MVILFIMLASAAGTAIGAPFIDRGLVPLAAAAAVLEAAAVACLFLPKMSDAPASS